MPGRVLRVSVAAAVSPEGAPPGESFASPKSSTFTWPDAVSITFAGLTSRWMIPAACAAASARSTSPA